MDGMIVRSGRGECSWYLVYAITLRSTFGIWYVLSGLPLTPRQRKVLGIAGLLAASECCKYDRRPMADFELQQNIRHRTSPSPNKIHLG